MTKIKFPCATTVGGINLELVNVLLIFQSRKIPRAVFCRQKNQLRNGIITSSYESNLIHRYKTKHKTQKLRAVIYQNIKY